MRVSPFFRSPALALMATSMTFGASLASADSFRLTSPDLGSPPTMHEQFVFDGFGCNGGNQSPALEWSEPPAGTRSLALTVYDPDAPTGSGWWHWVTFNLPADTRSLPTNASRGENMPVGATQGKTDYGTAGYGGPCPPVGHGEHRYQFKLFALDVPRLDLPSDASAALVGFMLNQHRLGIAELEVTYGR